MGIEYVPLVDKQGNNIGKIVPRDRVHSEELRHPVVHVWVVNEKNELLIQKRAKNKPQYGGVWHISVAGHITVDKSGVPGSPKEEAIREVEEELGITFDTSELFSLGGVAVSQIIPEDGVRDKEWINLFLLRVNKDEIKLSLQEEEVQDAKWISLDQLLKDIGDETKRQDYLNHPQSYYTSTVSKIRNLK